MSNEFNIFALNLDQCPKSDAVLKNTYCSGCQFYKGFVLANGSPCVKCAYYSESESIENMQSRSNSRVK